MSRIKGVRKVSQKANQTNPSPHPPRKSHKQWSRLEQAELFLSKLEGVPLGKRTESFVGYCRQLNAKTERDDRNLSLERFSLSGQRQGHLLGEEMGLRLEKRNEVCKLLS